MPPHIKSSDHRAEAGSRHPYDGAHLEQLGIVTFSEQRDDAITQALARTDTGASRPGRPGQVAQVVRGGGAVVLALLVEERTKDEPMTTDGGRQPHHRPEQPEREVRALVVDITSSNQQMT